MTTNSNEEYWFSCQIPGQELPSSKNPYVEIPGHEVLYFSNTESEEKSPSVENTNFS